MELFLGSILSFSILHYTTHPNSKIHKRIPSKRFFNFQFSPHINFSIKERIIHFHHWMIFSPIFVFVQSGDKGFLSGSICKGLLLGGIVQGLLYKDRFKVIFKHQDYHSISSSQYNLQSLVKFWGNK